MSNVIQETIFPGSGLNTDENINFIDLGSSEWRLNILVSEDGSSGVITNMKGNTRAVDIADHQLNLASEYITICSYYNRLTRKVYYFLWTQPYETTPGSETYLYDNKLLCYNEDSNTLDLIFTDTANWFGFEYNMPVRDCSMIGDNLYFNPRASEPKMINVSMAYNYTNYPAYDPLLDYSLGDTVTYYGGCFVANNNVIAGASPVTDHERWDRIGGSYIGDAIYSYASEFEIAFNVIRIPPVSRPSLVYGYGDPGTLSNNVRGRLFRFAYLYKYFDNTKSVYSAYSDIALPEDDEEYNGEIGNEITRNNYITISIDAFSPALVKEIEIIFQDSRSSLWKRAKIIDRQEQSKLLTTSFTYDFYNNESYFPVDITKAQKVEDAVPRKANAQELINKNILSYGGCTEGFPNLSKEDLEVYLNPVLEEISIPIVVGTLIRDNMNMGDITYDSGPYGQPGNTYIRIGTWWAGGVSAGDIYTLTLNNQTNHYTILQSDVDDVGNIMNSLVYYIGNWYGSFNVSLSPQPLHGDDYIQIAPSSLSPAVAKITQSVFSANGGDSPLLKKRRGFKTGANHPFCLFYYDASLRRWEAQTSSDNEIVDLLQSRGTSVYVPMFNEVIPIVPDTTANRWKIEWTVDHLPPVGAKYWKWGYAGNTLCSNFVQYVVHEIIDSDPTSPALEGANMIKIDITPLQTIKNTVEPTWNQFPTSVMERYTWQPGDRVRFITEESIPAFGTTLGDVIHGVYDFEIIKTDEDETHIFIQGQLADYPDIETIVGENTLVEIYTPLKSLEDTKLDFYEFGDLMPIIEDSDGNMVHGSNNPNNYQDWALGIPATGTFDGGDVYHILRTPSSPIDTSPRTTGAFHESKWYSDFYPSDDYDKGKIGYETTYGERFLNIIRFSNPYFQNTLINGLSTFEGDSFKELNDTYGHIVAMLEMGDTMKVYQERKASSILVGRTEYKDASGSDQVMVSNLVFGAIRYSASNYSTVYTESISRNNKFLYGFDVYNGVVWRDGVNGIFPISGRYAEAGGDANYKMQTYFKLKTKALMVSGVANTSVLTVWDEEFKNLYVTFKDRVDANNNDTIVFHEPSNRWICFTEFDRTIAGGYDTPLEPTYSILLGFENGLGYSFDELTRFSHFDFTTAEPPVDNNVYIVDEDNTTYIIDEDGATDIIE